MENKSQSKTKVQQRAAREVKVIIKMDPACVKAIDRTVAVLAKVVTYQAAIEKLLNENRALLKGVLGKSFKKPGDTDKLILVTGHHPDEATVELSVFRPEPQTIVLLKSELPFVVGALQDYIKD